MSNRANRVVKNYKRKTCLLIDISEPTDNIISLQNHKKMNKYKDQEIEIKKLSTLKPIPYQ